MLSITPFVCGVLLYLYFSLRARVKDLERELSLVKHDQKRFEEDLRKTDPFAK